MRLILVSACIDDESDDGCFEKPAPAKRLNPKKWRNSSDDLRKYECKRFLKSSGSVLTTSKASASDFASSAILLESRRSSFLPSSGAGKASSKILRRTCRWLSSCRFLLRILAAIASTFVTISSIASFVPTSEPKVAS